MNSIVDLLNSIMSASCVDVNLKVRAGYLKSQITGKSRGFDLFNLFGDKR